MKKKSVASQSQLVVTLILAVAYIVSGVQVVSQLFSLKDSVSDPTSWIVWFLLGQVFPLLAFGVLWFVTKGVRRERLYQATLAAFTANIFVNMVSTVILVLLGTRAFISLATSIDWSTFYNILSIVLWAGTITFFFMSMKKRTTPEELSRYVQKVLVYVVTGSALAAVLQEGYYILLQLPDNQNLSSFYLFFVVLGVVAVLFIPVYIIATRQKVVKRYRLATFFTTVALTVVATLSYVVGPLSSANVPLWLLSALAVVAVAAAVVGYKWLYGKVKNLFI